MSNTDVSERRFDAIAFDFDGTITFGEDYLRSVIADTARLFCNEAGVSFDAVMFKKVWNTHLGQGIPNYFAQYLHALTQEGRASEAQRIKDICLQHGPSIAEAFSAKYIEANKSITDAILKGELDPEDKNFKLRFGIRETMLQAQADGLKVIVVSNSITQTLLNNLAVCGIYLKGTEPRQNALADREPIFIDCIIGSQEVLDAGLEKKPSPDPYFLGADRIGVSTSRMIIAEDSPAGFRSAFRAKAGAIIACDHQSVEHPIPTQIYVTGADGNPEPKAFNPAYILKPGGSMLDAYISVRDGIVHEPDSQLFWPRRLSSGPKPPN